MRSNVTYRWESARRYYAARLECDLLGDWVVQVACGGLFNRLGQCWTVAVSGEGEGLRELDAIAKLRAVRRYALV